MEWKRVGKFGFLNKNIEEWIYSSNGKEKINKVEVTYGKKLDVLDLKKNITEDLNKFVLNYTKKDMEFSRYLFKSEDYTVDYCPICNKSAKNFKEVLRVYNMVYSQCDECGHVFVINMPDSCLLNKYYEESKGYQSTYTDSKTIKTRIEDVITSKFDYTIEQYKRIYNKYPRKLLDIGAGSGHFVNLCREKGIQADGIEISESGRNYCKQNYEIDMFKDNFKECSNKFKDYDIITLWGVVEHIDDVMKILKSCRDSLDGNEQMLIVEVPRWDCFTTSIQDLNKNSIIRHISPMVGHINMFTEESLATAFVRSGFNIVGAWYYGMDIYELLMQIAYNENNISILTKQGKLIDVLQQVLDQARLSDQLTLVGIPR